jgi:hypothetical protein
VLADVRGKILFLICPDDIELIKRDFSSFSFTTN